MALLLAQFTEYGNESMKSGLRVSGALASLLVLAGCAEKEGAFFQSPNPGTAPEIVRLSTSSTAESVASVASTLKRNGFSITRASSASGVVEGSANGSAFVDCGLIIQYALGNKAQFEGASPLSVIYTSGETVDFVLRGVSARTQVRVLVDGSVANVTENHDVTMTWSNPEGKGTRTDRRPVRPGELTRFEDNTACVTSDRVADLLR